MRGQVSAVSQQTGVPVSTLKTWVRRGLVSSEGTPRTVDSEEVLRVAAERAAPAPRPAASPAKQGSRPVVVREWKTVDMFGHPLRVAVEEPVLFILNDACAPLEYANPRDVLARLSRDDVAQTDVIDSLGRTQRMTVIGEGNFWLLVIGSKQPNARAFASKLCLEVLPAMRKTGKAPDDFRPEIPGVANPQIEQDRELAQIEMWRASRLRELARDAEIRRIAAEQTQLAALVAEGQKKTEERIVASTEETQREIDAKLAKERGNCALPGEVEARHVAKTFGWLSEKGLSHPQAVTAAARIADFEARRLVVCRDWRGADGVVRPGWLFTPDGLRTFGAEVDAAYPQVAQFVVKSQGRQYTVHRAGYAPGAGTVLPFGPEE